METSSHLHGEVSISPGDIRAFFPKLTSRILVNRNLTPFLLLLEISKNQILLSTVSGTIIFIITILPVKIPRFTVITQASQDHTARRCHSWT